MAIVNVQPMPKGVRAISERFRPMSPPVFPEGEASADDIELARALFLALDPDSQAWYRRCAVFAGLA